MTILLKKFLGRKFLNFRKMLQELEQLEEGGYSQALYFVKYYPTLALPGTLHPEFAIAKAFHRLFSQWLSGGLPNDVQKRIRIIFPELTGLQECQSLYHFISLVRLEATIPGIETHEAAQVKEVGKRIHDRVRSDTDSLKMLFEPEEPQVKKRPAISPFLPIDLKKQKIIPINPAPIVSRSPTQWCHSCETLLKREENECSVCKTPKTPTQMLNFGQKETTFQFGDPLPSFPFGATSLPTLRSTFGTPPAPNTLVKSWKPFTLPLEKK